MSSFAVKHLRILEKLEDPSGAGYLTVREIARWTGMDPRTVRVHLEAIQADKLGVYLDEGKRYFATKKGIINLAQRLGLELKTSVRRRRHRARRSMYADRSQKRYWSGRRYGGRGRR